MSLLTQIKDKLAIQTSNFWDASKTQSQERRSVVKLIKGSMYGQIITVASYPLLTRIYNPTNFGILASFGSILALIDVVSSLRYELAVSTPKEDKEAIELVYLCIGLIILSAAITALAILLAGNIIISQLNEPGLSKVIWLLPIGVLFAGIYKSLNYWAIRTKQFTLLAKIKARRSLFGTTTSILASPLGSAGLVLGQVVNQSAGLGAIFRSLFKSPIVSTSQKINTKSIAKTLVKYRHFAIFGSSAGLINTIGNQLPFLIFASTFGPDLLGQIAVSQRLLLLPADIIGVSFGQVFLSEASQKYRDGALKEFIKVTFKKLLLLGLATSLVIIIVVAPLMPVIFGAQWATTLNLLPLLIPIFIAQVSITPFSTGFFAMQKNKAYFLTQCIVLGAKLIPLLISIQFFDFYKCVLIYSISVLTGSIIVLCSLNYCASEKNYA